MKLTTTALACALAIIAHAATAQTTFSSGSTGADGALNLGFVSPITVRAGGVYNYTTVNITGSVQFLRGEDNSPLVILATGDVTISGTMSVSGNVGLNPGANINGATVGSGGGPGGFNGGNGGFSSSSNPAANVPASAGHGPGGGAPGTASLPAQGSSYGAPSSFVALTPLFGGSGGGGGGVGGTGTISGGSGGGGGGAVLIASSTRIIVNGIIRANGGNSTTVGAAFCHNVASAGSGGAIRLVAPEIIGTGTLQAVRGNFGGSGTCAASSTPAGDGRIRLEAFSPIGFSGVTTPVASVATAPGAVSPAGTPALGNVPTLAITSIGGLAVPANPGASYFAPDLALPLGTVNPVQVVLSATNTPVGAPTAITVRVIPQSPGTVTNVTADTHTGSFVSSTANANVTLPAGQVTVLQASAAMTLTGQTASLFPLIDGEPVERVLVAATPGQASTLSLVTRSGKEVRLDQMRLEDQVRVAQAWDVLKAQAN